MISDGFDNSSATRNRWATTSSTSRVTFSSAAARFGVGQGMNLIDSCNAVRTLGGNKTTVRLQFGHWANALAPAGGTNFLLLDSASAIQTQIGVTATGAVTAYRGATLLNTTASGLIAINTYNYWEIEVVYHATTGSIYVRLNGVNVIINLTGINTISSAETGASNFKVQNVGDGWTQRFDDLIMSFNGDAAPYNALVGDCNVYGRFGNAVGASSMMTRVGGTASGNYTATNEVVPDDDTSYVKSSVLNDKDSYGVPALPANAATVLSMAVTVMARKDDGVTRGYAALLKSGATESLSADVGLSATHFHTQGPHYVNDPNTSAAWTIANANTVEIGQKVTV